MPEEKRGQQAVSTSPLMPLDNGWLKETADKVRARQTAWEGYQRAELISSEELQMLRDAEQAGRDKQFRTVLEKEPQYAALYTRLFGKLSRADTIQQVVLLADDLVQAAPDRLDAFLDAPQLYASLLKLFDVQDAFVSLKAAQFLALFLTAQSASSSHGAPPHEVLEKLLAFLNKQLQTALDGSDDDTDGNAVSIALLILGEVVRQAPFRARVWKQAVQAPKAPQSSIVGTLVSLEEKMASSTRGGTQTPREGTAGYPQLQYQGLFVLWVLTFDPEAAAGIDERFELATVLVRLAQTALKHKIVRLIVGIWDNMLTAPDASEEDNATRLLGAKVLPLCKTLQERNYPDDEMRDQLKYVVSVLSNRLDQMSSYEEYQSELQSKHLSFDNPVHTLDEFWKENAEKLVEHNEQDLKLLVSLVKPETHSDATTLAVACHDIGRFVHHFETGRRRVTALGAKDAIMGLVDYDDPEVRHAALQTLAVLVSSSWK